MKIVYIKFIATQDDRNRLDSGKKKHKGKSLGLRQFQFFNDSHGIFPINHTHYNNGFIMYPIEDSKIS